MRIGILTTRDRTYHGNNRLLQAARDQGHEPVLIHPLHCRPYVDSKGALRMEYADGPEPDLDLLMPRVGSTIDDFELAVTLHFESRGVCLFNTTSSIISSRDKFTSLQILSQNGLHVPATELVHRYSSAREAAECLGWFPLVLKRRRGRKGRGVMLVESLPALTFVLEGLNGTGEAVLLQEYIQAEEVRELRVLVVGERVCGSMGKRPKEGDFRSNIDLTGKGYPVELTDLEAQTALRAAAALGMDAAGVDLLSHSEKIYILEVNYTPGFKELERISGLDIAQIIVHAAVEKARREKGSKK